MEFRKLISFGKSSYVISLPKSWIKSNNLKKGDLINIDIKNRNLILGPSTQMNDKLENKEILILVDNKSIRRIKREIISAYINDYKTITLSGSSIKDKAREIQNTIQNLMALEIMEQTSNKIVAKDFLDMSHISIYNLIRKMDVILRSMIDDCEKSFIEINSNDIAHRDEGINRLSFLIFRVIDYGYENPSSIFKQFNLNCKDLLNLWWFVFNIESIGDEVKRIAKYMGLVKLNKKEQDLFLKYLSLVKENYLHLMKCFYNDNSEKVYDLLESQSEILKELDAFYLNNHKVDYLGLLIEKVKSTISHIHNLGRVIYQRDSPKSN